MSLLLLFGGEASTTVVAPTEIGGKRLGCGKPRFFLAERGGNRLLAELNVTSYSYGRRLDAVSSCSVTLAAEQDARCLMYLRDLEAWERELVVYRDGVEAWVGPMVEPTWRVGDATLNARDLLAWLERRLIRSDLSFESEDLSSIAAAIAEDALSVDDSAGIQFLPSDTGVLGTRTYAAATYPKAFDAILELARTGFDFTAVGRTIRTGGMEVPTEPLVTLTNDTLEVTEVTVRGLDQASRVVMIGAQDALDLPLSAEADLGVTSFGVLEQVFNEQDIEDLPSLGQAAQTRLDLLRDSPFMLTGRLSQDVGVNFDEIVPGARVDLRLAVGFKEINEVGRLVSVDVNGTEGTETVNVTIESLGTVNV